MVESDSLRGIGWYAKCDHCGWSGRIRRAHIDAVRDRKEHRCEDSDNAA